MTRSIRWLLVPIEGVVITGSILLAFGIDAWWQGRRDPELEVEALASVALEVGETQTAPREPDPLVA